MFRRSAGHICRSSCRTITANTALCCFGNLEPGLFSQYNGQATGWTTGLPFPSGAENMPPLSCRLWWLPTPPTYPAGTDSSFSREQNGRGLKMTALVHVVQRIKMCWAMPSLHHAFPRRGVYLSTATVLSLYVYRIALGSQESFRVLIEVCSWCFEPSFVGIHVPNTFLNFSFWMM
jgi:hypothetical protein